MWSAAHGIPACTWTWISVLTLLDESYSYLDYKRKRQAEIEQFRERSTSWQHQCLHALSYGRLWHNPKPEKKEQERAFSWHYVPFVLKGLLNDLQLKMLLGVSISLPLSYKKIEITAAHILECHLNYLTTQNHWKNLLRDADHIPNISICRKSCYKVNWFLQHY